MKWTDMVVLVALIVLVGWLGNGLLSCTSDIRERVAVSTEVVTVDIDKTSLFEHGYFRVGMSENVTLEYFDSDWWALDFDGSDFAIYQRLEAWLDKDYKYKISERFIDNK